MQLPTYHLANLALLVHVFGLPRNGEILIQLQVKYQKYQ